MTSCNYESVKEYVFNMGSLLTNNSFFLEDNLWIEILEHKQYVTNYTGQVASHRLVQSSAYLAWNYKTGHKRFEDAKTFRTQLMLFKYFKENREGFMDLLIEDLINFELCDIAIRSEHMF